MPNDVTNSLIDRELIARAGAKLDSAVSRLKTASDDMQTAKIALTRAEQAAARAPSLENETALEQAQRAARVAEKAHAAAVTAHRNIAAWVPLARGVAHSGLYVSGLRGRVAAAAKADAARTLLAEADADMRTAAVTCHEAHVAGHPNIRGLNNRPVTVTTTAAEEMAAIQAEGIDLETGTYAWLEYAKSQEKEV